MTAKKRAKKNIVTQTEFAKMAGVPRQYVYKAINAGKIGVDKNRRVRLDDPSTKLWLDEKLVENGKAPANAAAAQDDSDTSQQPTASVMPGTAKPLAQIKIEEEINRIRADTRLKELKYAKERGELIERERLGTVLFKYLDALNTNMLDVPDMVVDMVIDMVKAGSTRGAIIEYMKKSIQESIRSTKKQIKARLKK